MLRVWASIPGLSGLGSAALLDVVQQPNTGNLVLQLLIGVVGLFSSILGHRKVNKMIKEQRASQGSDTTIVKSKNTDL